jgi:hypothetical protein
LKEERKSRDAATLIRYLGDPISFVEQRLLGFSALALAPAPQIERHAGKFGRWRLVASSLWECRQAGACEHGGG